MAAAARLRWGATLLVAAALLSTAVGAASFGPPGPAAGRPAPDGSGSLEVASAVESLAHADGPANGRAWHCTTPTLSSADCSPSSAFARASTSTVGWTNITSRVVPLPGPRLSTMTWDASDGYVLLYGGVTLNATDQLVVDSDTWSYVNGTWTNLTRTVVGGPPPEAEDAVLSYDPWTGLAVLVGGTSAVSSNLSLTWTYHAGVWTNITATAGTPPSPRWLPVFVADVASHQMLLFGGASPNSDHGLDDTWLFTGSAWSNITGTVGTSPPDLAGLSGTYDPAESGILVLGTSYAGPPYLGATYLFTGGAWHNLTSSQSATLPLLQYPAIGYAPQTSSVIAMSSEVYTPISGGADFFPVEWTFSAGQWTNTTADGLFPAAASGGAATVDGNGDLLEFGGTLNYSSPEQWMYAYSASPSSVAVTVHPATLDTGVSTAVTATFSGGLPPETTTLSFGDGHSTNGTLSASHSYSGTGTFTVAFNVTDFAGRSASGTASVTVTAPPSGVVVHASALTATTGTAINFTGTFDGGTAPFTTGWTFGDGTSSSATASTHAFSAGGISRSSAR